MANVVFANGDALISVSPDETEARFVFTPNPDGFSWDPAALNKLAVERNLSSHIDPKELETFLTKAKKAKSSDPLEMVFAQGIPPEEPAAEAVKWEELPVPGEMKTFQDDVVADAGAPQIYRIKIEKIKHEKTVKKAFGKEDVEVSWEKKELREKADVNPKVHEIKYAEKETKLGTISPSFPGKPGKSVFGRQIPPRILGDSSFLFGKGIEKRRNELFALYSGFLRIGENWADIVPFAKHSYTIFTAADGLTYFLSFEPGDDRFSVPSGDEILTAAMAKGAQEGSLIAAMELDEKIAMAVKNHEPVEALSLFHQQEAEARVDINADKTKAVLYLRKGLAGAQPLEMSVISQALKKSGVPLSDTEQLKLAIRDFMDGKDLVLPGYVLAEGKSSTRGKDKEVQVEVTPLSEDKEEITSRLKGKPDRAGSEVLKLYPNGAIELAFVQKGEIVTRVYEESKGEDGVDIFGNVIPGLPGNDPEIKLFNGLELHGSEISASKNGLLVFLASGRIFFGEVIDYEDAQIKIQISDDAMEAKGDFLKESGPGRPLTVENVKEEMDVFGIKKGIDWNGLERACEFVREKGSINGYVIAKGAMPIAKGGSAVKWLIPVSRNKALQVKAGIPIVELSEPEPLGKAGFNVRGNNIPVEEAEDIKIEHDESVKELPSGKGKRLVALRSGDLIYDGKLLKISSVKTIYGNAEPVDGGIKFSGEIVVNGDVLPGTVVMGGSHVTVAGLATEAFVSAGGKAVIGMGFKGGGRGVLRARAGITSAFIERASVMAIGDIQLNKGSILSGIKTNGKLVITSEDGKLVGGVCRARHGIDSFDIGSDKSHHTAISFGQDYFIKDEIAECEEKTLKIEDAHAKIEAKISDTLRNGLPLTDELRTEKVRLTKLLEQMNMKLFTLREKFEEHFESEIIIRGAVFPGVVIESHNRYYEVKQKRNRVIFYFDRESGRIKEKPLD